MKRLLNFDSDSVNLETLLVHKDDTSNANGKYDIILVDRSLVQDNFHRIKKYMNDNTKIVVNLCRESGCYENWLEKFHLIAEQNSKTQFFYISDVTHDYNFPENVKSLCSYYLSFNVYFETRNVLGSEQVYWVHPSVFNKENGACCLNGRLRAHRLYTLLEFCKRELFDTNNYFSFLFYSNKNEFDRFEYLNYIQTMGFDKEEQNILLEKMAELPIRVDAQIVPGIIWEETPFSKILNLVSENVVGLECDPEASIITFTEKSWVPFKTHQIPIYMANKGHVDQIRKLGFDVFDDIVDHSYDSIEDPIERIKLCIDELERLLEIDLVFQYKKHYRRFVKNSLLCDNLKAQGSILLEKFFLENDLIC